MATDLCLPQCPTIASESTRKVKVKRNHQPTFFEPLSNSTHGCLTVCDTPDVPQLVPEIIQVTVFDPCRVVKVPLFLRSTDTIGKLQKDYLKLRPELVGRLNLAYNGKPVQLAKTLGELKVKPGAVFVTYQKCHGG